VVPGDNLKRIAHRFRTMLSRLVALNERTYPSLRKNPYRVRPGWVLIVDGVPPGASEPSRPAARTYTVLRGDDLKGVARRFHTTAARLAELNRIRYPSLETNPRLMPGWVLTVS